MNKDSILNINSKVGFDENITRYEIHSYSPYTSISLDTTDNIIINVNQESTYLLVSESGIYLEGKITKEDGKDLDAGSNISFINNGLCYLFDEIRLEMNSVELDSTKMVGVSTTMKGYASYSSEEMKKFETTGWNQKIAFGNNFTFSGYIPLKFVLGFAETYEKIILNQRLDLILIRSKNVKDCLLSTTVTNAKVQLTKVQWRIPHIEVADNLRLAFLSQYKKNTPIDMSFRRMALSYFPSVFTNTKEMSWNVKSSVALEKPRYVILGFQTDRDNSIAKDPSQFDHVKLKNVKLYLNSTCFPYENLNIDFVNKKYIPLYLMYCAFQESYYGKIAEPYLNYSDFLTKAPLCIIDCSKQAELWKHGSTVDIRIEYETHENVAANTTLYALIIHDTILRLFPLTNTIQKIL